MARMPQIPQPDINRRPDGNVERANLPAAGPVGEAFNAGADMAADLGANVEFLEARRQAAQEKIQEVLDTTTAIKALGEHSDRLRSIASQLQQQFLDDPQKAVDAFKTATQQETDTAVKGAPNGNAALRMLPMFSRTNNAAEATMSDWAQRRGILNAKNALAQMEFAATHGLENLSNSHQLEAHIRDTDGMVAALQKQLTPDAAKAARKLRERQVDAWVEQRSAVGPVAALDTIAELKNPNSFIYKSLDADKRQKALKLAQDSYEGAQKRADFDMFASHHREMGNLSTLLQANDPKFTSTAYSLRLSVEQQMEANDKNPGLDEPTKTRLRSGGEMMLRSIDAAQTAYRKQRGLEQAKIDQDVRGKLLSRNTKLFTKGQLSLNEHYEDGLRLRHDNLEAFSKGQIPYQTYELIENGLKSSLAVRDVQEGRNVGGFHATILGMTFGWQSPRQAGNEKLNELFTGAYRKASLDQQNNAREYYMRQLYDATVSGTKVDRASALQMAVHAADFAMGR